MHVSFRRARRRDTLASRSDDASETDLADLWLDRVDADPKDALEALTELLGSEEAARDAMMNAPVLLSMGRSVGEVQEHVQWLEERGLRASGRPPRRMPTAKVNAESEEPTRNADEEQSAPVAGDAGRAEVAFTASLLASFHYPFHREAVIATLVTLGATFGLGVLLALVPGVLFVLQIPILLAIVGVQFAFFMFAVRASAEGRDRYAVRADDSLLVTVMAAGARSITLHVVMFAPMLLTVMGPISGLKTIVLVLYLVAVLVAMPGTYAVTAMSDSFVALNPFVGLTLARRLPLAYTLMGAFMLIVLASGSLLASLPSVLVLASGKPSIPLILVGTILGMIVNQALMLGAGRILGIFIHSNRDELGL